MFGNRNKSLKNRLKVRKERISNLILKCQKQTKQEKQLPINLKREQDISEAQPKNESSTNEDTQRTINQPGLILINAAAQEQLNELQQEVIKIKQEYPNYSQVTLKNIILVKKRKQQRQLLQTKRSQSQKQPKFIETGNQVGMLQYSDSSMQELKLGGLDGQIYRQMARTWYPNERKPIKFIRPSTIGSCLSTTSLTCQPPRYHLLEWNALQQEFSLEKLSQKKIEQNQCPICQISPFKCELHQKKEQKDINVEELIKQKQKSTKLFIRMKSIQTMKNLSPGKTNFYY